MTIILEEAVSNNAKTGPINLPGGVTFEDSTPIEHTSSCRVFSLYWRSYVSYCVTEEMVGSCGKYEDEEYSGKLLRIYSKSNFLQFIAKNTGAHFEPYRHFRIACLNHVIDVVATTTPELKSLSREEAAQNGKTGRHFSH